jgi:hypothetical protein
MKISIQKPLFAWDCLEDHPTLGTIKELLEAIPDEKLLDGLRTARGKGRDEYPVRVLWGVVLLTYALRHRHFESCLGELHRNPSLAKQIGIESEDQIPRGWNVSRFLQTLGQEPHLSEMRSIFDGMVKTLGGVVPDLGKAVAGDATALNARRLRDDAKKHKLEKEQQASTGKTEDETKAAKDKAPEEKIKYDKHGLPQPSGGRKEYKDDQGRVTKIVEWFGYKLHLLVCAKHEVALAYRVSSTKVGDNEMLPPLVDEAMANLPPRRIQTLAYDKAADDNKVHEKLHQARIKPLIQMRSLWKEEPERMLPGHDGNSNVVYDEAGTLYCYDRASQPMIRRQMAYIGHEASRGTLKYRCPALHAGLPCAMSEICNAGKQYGMTVRVKQAIDLRRFPPIPRATKQFERLYKERTSVERVNGRFKIFWGVDDGNVTGAARFHAMVGTVLIVHAAFATLLASLPRREGTLGKMNLSPIAKALHDERADRRRRRPMSCRRRSRKRSKPSPHQRNLFR